MVRKYILPAIAIAIMITLFVMYRNQHKLYQKTLQANYSLNTHLRELEQKNQQITQAIQQMQQAEAAAPLLKATFVDQRKYYRQNWKNYIHVSLNNYKTGFLGGIHHLKVKVNNDTEFSLDHVVVLLKYYRSNDKLFKTEKVSIGPVKAKSSQNVSAPESRKGMKVKLQLERITSQKMNFCWSAGKKAAPGDNDPYQCVTKK